MRNRHAASGSVTRHVSIDTRDGRDALTVTTVTQCDGKRDATVTPNVTAMNVRGKRLVATLYTICTVQPEPLLMLALLLYTVFT